MESVYVVGKWGQWIIDLPDAHTPKISLIHLKGALTSH